MRSSCLFLVQLFSLVAAISAQDIAFTNKLMQQDKFEVPNPSKTSFKLGEGIYAVANLPTPIVKTTVNGTNPANQVNLGYFVKINGEPIVSNRTGRFAQPVPGAMFTRAVSGSEMYEYNKLYLVVIPDEKHPRLNVPEVSYPGKAFLDGIAKAGPGTHKVDVELRYATLDGQMGSTLAKGNFTLVVDKVQSLDLGGDLPKAQMTNPALVQTMKTALARGGWQYQVLKINIIRPDWQIHRNVLGVITHRSIDTYVAFKMNDGKCKAFNISFKQAFAGGGYGATQVNGTGDSFEISCEKV